MENVDCLMVEKGGHKSDNIEKITGNLIRIINENNPNFSMIENKTGLIFTEISGFNILGIHGEVKKPFRRFKRLL